MQTQLDAALAAIGRGWPVFPCKSDKSPMTQGGFKDATTDEAQVRKWWERWPGAMVGVPTGKRSGMWALDVDTKGGDGHAELAALIEQHDDVWFPTPVVRTPSGGAHYLWRMVDGVRNRAKVSANIDVRGEGGYVIAAGSVNSDGEFYEWYSTGEPAGAPQWLLDLIIKREPEPQEAKPVPAPTPTLAGPNMRYVQAAIDSELAKLLRTGHHRNDALNDAAFALGQFVGAGVLPYAEAEALLFNAAVGNGYVAKDGSADAYATIRSGLSSGQAQPRQIPQGNPKRRDDVPVKWQEIANQLIEAEEAKQQSGVPVQAITEAVAAAQRFQMTPYVWQDPRTLPRIEWLYGKHYARGFVSLTVAPGASGKSLLGIGEAITICTGLQLLDDSETGRVHQPGLKVWLFNGEDSMDMLKRRIQAFCMLHHVTREQIEGKLYVNSGMDYTVKVAADAKDGIVRQPMVDAIVAEIERLGIDILIVDPFVTTHTVNENDNSKIDAVARLWTDIAERCRVAVVLWHHTRKVEKGISISATDSRGGGALINAARSVRVINHMTAAQATDAGISMDEAESIKQVAYDKENNGPKPRPHWMRIESVRLGNDGLHGYTDAEIEAQGLLGEPSDFIGAMRGWRWPAKPDGAAEAAKVDDATKEAILNRLAASRHVVSDTSKRWAGAAVCEYLKLDAKADKAQVLVLLQAWVDDGTLRIEKTGSPSKPVQVYGVGELPLPAN